MLNHRKSVEEPVEGGSSTSPSEREDPPVGLMRGLSGKLLILTVIFVMIAEVLIFVPSVANFRNVWLQTHLDTAEAASIVYLDSSDPMLSADAQRDLLQATGSLAVVIIDGPMRMMMARAPIQGEIRESIDLTQMRPLQAIRSSLSLLLTSQEGIYRVFGPMKSKNGTIELVQNDRSLRQALLIYSRNVLFLSLAISLITASLVMIALHWLIVRPVQRLSKNMTEFSREPDNAALILKPTDRRDEIGIAERRLAAFEMDLHNTLRQRQHLAELGLAVSKINHDLRNILASAQLFSDRISQLPDPTVQRVAPKLLRSLDRAIGYTRSVLAYGKAVEEAPNCRLHRLHAIADEVAEFLGVEQEEGFEWHNEIPPTLEIEADSEQIFRVMLNICRNAIQAMERDEMAGPAAVRRLRVTAVAEGDDIRLRIADTGPGIASVRQSRLFQAFAGSDSVGGTGLGLAIAAELVRAHGGRISMEATSAAGTTFCIVLPARADRRLEGRKNARASRPDAAQ